MTVTADPKEVGTTTVANETRSSNMSLTYSDFLYTRNEYTEGHGDREERRSLPHDFKAIRETTVPLMQNAEAHNQDFIIIAEFSELEGPIPLCTIPNDTSDKSDIKLNDFVVHLMSTDYQVNTVGQFRICQDTQVMRKNVFPDVHVLMQYFTLYDIKARGFVRPFCFGYVSKDHVKLDKFVNFLICEFKKVTAVLEHCNREWFCKELKEYLNKLETAKDSYIRNQSNSVDEEDNKNEEFLDSDTVSLSQIAHQYSEIQNILTTVENFENTHNVWDSDINDIFSFIQLHHDSAIASFLQRNGIACDSTAATSVPCSSAENVNIPLVHPLRVKGEPLRPLTVLGQLGAIYLVGKLIHIHTSCKMDTIFTEMTDATANFKQHFNNFRILAGISSTNGNANCSPGKSSGFSSSADINCSTYNNSATDSSPYSDDSRLSSSDLSQYELFQDATSLNSAILLTLNNKHFLEIIEKLHVSGPLIPDNKSGSYHTVSEEDSDINIASQVESATELEFATSIIGVSPSSTSLLVEEDASKEKHQSVVAPLNQVGIFDREPLNSVKMSSLNSFSSDEEMSLGLMSSNHETSEETVRKEPWWNYSSRKLVRGVPGYGLANFFRRYHEAAHHVLYSILLGRPIIICGEEKLSRKIGRIITALIPLVPSVSTHSHNRSFWKLLRWHRGILVQAHIEAYRLIGLCIPEKLEVHDLIPPRLVTLVTILSVDKKCILGGPAYFGDLLQSFEKNYQQHYYNSDVSLLSYIGGIYADIESKVFMYKSLADKYKVSKNLNASSNATHLLFKELNVRSSDAEIIKNFANLISNPCDCVNIL